MSQTINIGLVGATGMVGEEFLKILAERRFPVGTLKLFASEASRGLSLGFNGKKIAVESLSADAFKGLDLVFFSSGDDISKEWAPKAVTAGAYAIDNSAAFRLNQNCALVVPEINSHELKKTPTIIANPNCSTIQLTLALQPLLRDFDIESVHVATYQAVSGAGRAAQEELRDQTERWLEGLDVKAEVLPQPIAMNVVPQIGSFNEFGFCSEEIKIMQETKKILSRQDIRVSAFTVRVPVWNGHSEAVWVRLKKSATVKTVRDSLKTQSGVQLLDDTPQSPYPLALKASGTDPVWVGRVHQDTDDPKTFLMWIVSDNLRKGAALNGVQIAERIFDISP